MLLTFIHPNLLWLLLLLPLFWALALLGPRRIGRARFWASLTLRTLIVAGLVLALAGAQIVRAIGATTTMFLLDGSDSVALSQRAQAEGFIQQALAAMPADDRAGLVVFGRDALVERAPSAETTLGQVAALPTGSVTNIEAALQLGLAVLPNEGHQRLVLLSDGGQNSGEAEAAARTAAARGIPIDIVPLNGLADGPDAQISKFSVPASARAGQQLIMRLTIESSQPQPGRLIVEGPGGQVIADQPLDLTVAPLDLELPLPEPQQAFNRYTARIETTNDSRTINNAAEAYSFVSGRPRVLLVAGSPGAAANLGGALQAAAIDIELVEPSGLPGSIGGLSAYDAVALVDVSARAVPARTQAALAAYVHDLGRGLLMVGGPQSFGAGGWRDTPIEQVLPVAMDIPTEYRLPPASIVVLIDISGSMGVEEGGRTKLELAASGASEIARLMRDEDDITVIPFDSASSRIVGPVPGSRREDVYAGVRRIELGGGGINIHDGLIEAERFLNKSDKPVRHLITITDGDDTVQQEGALAIVQRLREANVTTTSIAIGDGKDVQFLRETVASGGGRFFLTQQAAEIPAIMTDEAQAVIRPYIVEEQFTPVQVANHPILRGLEGAPDLRGHVVTSSKQTAQVLLATPRGEPVLAAWQHGLGHAVAWTSDMRGQWAEDWVTWDGFAPFAARMVTWLLPAPDAQTLAVQAETINGQLVLGAQARDGEGRMRAGLSVRGQLLRGDGVSVEVVLRETGPGEYRAAVTDAPPGAYLVQLLAEDAQGQLAGAATAGAVVPQSAEYRTQGANPALLIELARLSGGRGSIQPQQAFEPNLNSRGSVSEIALPLLLLALLLLPVDIAVRRVFGGRMLMPLGRAPRVKASLPAVAHPVILVEGPAAVTKPERPPTKRAAELERLRLAQEAARKRARGEE
ncbi:MAG: VWA domain-containing protein [Roseiflexaceae bacterium]|nr:VWA domain-containing protein [Roseiflexaceae bacterium]